MGMSTKSQRDEATNEAIARYLEGNRVKFPAPNCKNLKNATWQGSKITCGFNMRDLRDGK